MLFSPSDIIPDVFLIDMERLEDERGYFARLFCRQEFKSRGLHFKLVQSSLSHNVRKGTLRGIHYQAPPHGETKIVRCIRGAVFDVVVDIRQGSPSYGRWEAFQLTGRNHKCLYLPPGIAHGFQTVNDDTELMYMMDREYEPQAARGIRWDDPTFGIAWPEVEERIISPKDRSLPFFNTVG